MKHFAKYVQTPTAFLLSALTVIFFLLSFDRRTDGFCAILVWVTSLLAMPLLLIRDDRRPVDFLAPRGLPVLCRLSLGGLVAWVSIAALSLVWSRHPAYTAESLFRELIPQTIVFLLLLRLRHNMFTEGLPQIRLLASAISLLGCVIGVIVVSRLIFATHLDPLYNKLGLILTDDESDCWRLLFPCNTHNRAAFFYMVAFTFLTAVLMFMKTEKKPALWFIGFLCMLLGISASMTRGVILSLMIFVLLLTIGYALDRSVQERKRVLFFILPVIIVAGAVWAVATDEWRAYIKQPFTAKAWVANKDTTTGMRLFIWKKTGTLIAESPLIGYGGGWENYQSVFRDRFPDAKDKMPETEFPAHHSHNVFMQVTFETGLIGLVAFTFFQFGRILFEIGVWIAALRRHGTALRYMTLVCATEISLLAYMMTNFPMRRGMGLIMFYIWGVCLAVAINVHNSQKEPFYR